MVKDADEMLCFDITTPVSGGSGRPGAERDKGVGVNITYVARITPATLSSRGLDAVPQAASDRPRASRVPRSMVRRDDGASAKWQDHAGIDKNYRLSAKPPSSSL